VKTQGFKAYKSIPQLFLYRLLRLLPLYYLIFLIGWLVMPFLGEGPIWFTYEKNFQQCNEYYWSVFTFTINFFPGNQNYTQGCFYWGWFVAAEVQIFLLLPFFIYLLYKSSKMVFAALLVVPFIGSLALNWYIAAEYNMSAQVLNPFN